MIAFLDRHPKLTAWTACALAIVSMAMFTKGARAQGTASLTWEAPTKNSDGSTLTDLDHFKVYWGTVQNTYPNSAIIGDPGVRAYVVTNLGAGKWFFVVSAFNKAGVESPWSNSASKTIATQPNPPTNLTVTQPSQTAWGVQQSSGATNDTDGKLTVFPVGTVPGGTPCSSATTVNGLAQVAKAAVIWAGDVRPPIVVSTCSGG